ncbi:hypothetical protein NDU88_005246 [Pleurodeles waltl]|uniref:Uncharacterized protein n=1 Tax=Pleurodeles waltl TaxID=8319 RepID=A0AAV7TTT0_PLEWA|nr:hypothetical protein NDU88_005246 [Pleurodeles waltl]
MGGSSCLDGELCNGASDTINPKCPHWTDEDAPKKYPRGTTGRGFPSKDELFQGHTLEKGQGRRVAKQEAGKAERRRKKNRSVETGDAVKENVENEDAGPDHKELEP